MFQFLSLRLHYEVRILAKLIFLLHMRPHAHLSPRTATQPQQRTRSDRSSGSERSASSLTVSSQPTLRTRAPAFTPSRHSACNPAVRLSREEQSILSLSPSLQRLRDARGGEGVQIRYVKTLKKVKAASRRLGCEVRVESAGFTLQDTAERHSRQQEASSYSFGKQFNRYFRRKMVRQLNHCTAANRTLENAMDRDAQEGRDAINLNAHANKYEPFTSHRMQTYVRSLSTEQKKLPFSVKKGLDKTFQQLKLLKEMPEAISRKTSEHEEGSEGGRASPMSPESPSKEGVRGSKSGRWSQLLAESSEDIAEFEQICDFFERIQHELLRYMPNNHLSNKINNIIAQVEHSAAIRRVYDQCNADLSQLTPSAILRCLRQEDGILSSMNYIVNVIKLNISAERRKRFQDLHKVITKYQGLTAQTASDIAQGLMRVESPEVKRAVDATLKRTDTNCRGMDERYLKFVRQAEEQEFSSIGSAQNRNIICEILKFESLMK